jgi:hypothetical protein
MYLCDLLFERPGAVWYMPRPHSLEVSGPRCTCRARVRSKHKTLSVTVFRVGDCDTLGLPCPTACTNQQAAQRSQVRAGKLELVHVSTLKAPYHVRTPCCLCAGPACSTAGHQSRRRYMQHVSTHRVLQSACGRSRMECISLPVVGQRAAHHAEATHTMLGRACPPLHKQSCYNASIAMLHTCLPTSPAPCRAWLTVCSSASPRCPRRHSITGACRSFKPSRLPAPVSMRTMYVSSAWPM